MAKNDPSGGPAPIIVIKKKKKVHGHAHHGGAWKVAYADFVTAMMAFFLLLWLLNVTSEEQKLGIAEYFAPASVATTNSGAGSILGGVTITIPGASITPEAPTAVNLGDPGMPAETENEEAGEPADRKAENKPPEADDKKLEEELAKREAEQFKQAEEALKQAMQSVPELQQLAQNLLIDQTPEGLRIQIVDQEGQSMFPLGSSQMFPQTRTLLDTVAKVVSQLPNKLSISGHTDAKPFAREDVYDNWELSTDRANASRRALVASGVDLARVQTVVGRAERDPLVKDDPADPRNRRISIVLLREAKLKAAPPAP